MNLTPVRIGDIVRVDKKGRVFLAEVTDRIEEDGKNTRLKIQPIAKGITYFEAQASEVKLHWKQMGRARS